jgi:tRNA dimethylallyltransferase
MKNTLIVFLGPTGVGKTDISIELALHFNCDIISADSRQFYREMKIGTAVPSHFQLSRIKHHFIQFLSVSEYYSSSLFERDVIKLLPSLFSAGNIAFMSGGSGMYIDAVCDGTDDIPDVDNLSRDKYIKMFDKQGIEGLRIALKILDPEHYSKVDLRNPKRIMRALEICESTGLPYSSFLKKNKRVRDFRIIKIGLTRERDELYTRINKRVDEMIEAGLEEEARSLLKFKGLNALNCVGYREFFDYFEGTTDKSKAIELIKRNSRRYAKRQMTWWSNDEEIKWFHPEKSGELLNYLETELKL